MSLRITPISLREANAFVSKLHRHHKATQGHKFSIAAHDGNGLVGVVIVGRPVARMNDNGTTAEVTRLCTNGARNACSILYGAAARAAFAMGYMRIITYTMPEEGGASLRASGWAFVGEAGGGDWSRPSRARNTPEHLTGIKHLWQKIAPRRHAAVKEEKP